MKLFGLSLGAILLLSGSSFGETEEEGERNVRRFNTPFIPCGADPSGKGSCLVLDKNIYQSLLEIPVNTLIEFNQFQTERNTKAILRLKRFSASVDGDDLDKVVLLRGAAFEDDSYLSSDDYLASFEMKASRTALIALSPYGSNGYVEIMNSTFILSTPWETKEEENKEEEEEYKENLINHNEYVHSLRTQAERFLPHMKNALKDFNMNYISVIYNSVILNRPSVILHKDYITTGFEEEGEEDGEYKAITKRSTPYDSSKELVKTFRIATDVDYDMYKRKGSSRDATSSYYYTLVGHSGSIYRRDFGSDFTSSYVKIYDKPDPYPSTPSGCLRYMEQNWSSTSPSRSFAALVSAKRLGGGVANIRSLCNTRTAYAVNGNMVGSYPIPVRSFDNGNWDIVIFLHEAGHVWGAQHTHSLNPPADKCGLSTPCPPTKGTIMSYCNQCQGGISNVELVFHTRNIDQVKQFVSTINC